jgi:phospho-N-acetylmuramoyl-pentapeptide-transferase
MFFVLWAAFIIVSCSNAVNLTDGLDGLAIGSLIPNFFLYTIIAYLAGHAVISWYLHIPFAGSAELCVVGATLIGASLGFLWYNTYPAQIFMGDVGSLALGAGLALMALMAKQELLLIISGGLFVLETVSVMMQVFAFKWWKRRIFKMAPIHHHFELLGWPESKITIRFGIISLILCLLALITIKIR